MGFSLGSSIAASLLLEPRETGSDRPGWAAARAMIRSAIFLCGITPFDATKLQDNELARVDKDDVGTHGRWSCIGVPTVHLWSPDDTEIPGESRALADMCVEDRRVELLHSAGHAVPSDSLEVEAAAAAIRGLFQRLQSE